MTSFPANFLNAQSGSNPCLLPGRLPPNWIYRIAVGEEAEALFDGLPGSLHHKIKVTRPAPLNPEHREPALHEREPAP